MSDLPLRQLTIDGALAMKEQRICTGCGAKADGLWPAGWTVKPVLGAICGVRAVVGELAWCPNCTGGDA